MDTDARKLNSAADRKKRATTVRLREQGYTYRAIGDALGLRQRTGAHWVEVARHEGAAVATGVGQRSALHDERRSLRQAQEELIRTRLTDKMLDQLKLGVALWTIDAVHELIPQRCRIDMSIRTTGEYLKRQAYTPQRPLQKAYQQKPEVAQRWLATENPRIVQRAKAEHAEIQWGDETRQRSDSHAGRSHAPYGQESVLQVGGSRFTTNMITTATNRGKLRCMLYRETLIADVLIRFLGRLVRNAPAREVLQNLHNLRVHHSKKVRGSLEERKKRIELFFLPAYIPDLSPDEYLTSKLEQHALTDLPVRKQDEGESCVRSAMKRLQLRPQRSQSTADIRMTHEAYADVFDCRVSIFAPFSISKRVGVRYQQYGFPLAKPLG